MTVFIFTHFSSKFISFQFDEIHIFMRNKQHLVSTIKHEECNAFS